MICEAGHNCEIEGCVHRRVHDYSLCCEHGCEHNNYGFLAQCEVLL